jgi:hypothetical protein
MLDSNRKIMHRFRVTALLFVLVLIYGCGGDQRPHLAPIEAGATDATTAGAEYERYVPRFVEVAEVVRRDPQCKKVMLVDIAKSKSTPANPVFMVMCSDASGRAFNIFLSYSELNKKKPL